MNLNKKIINLKGEEIPKTFPSKKELSELPKNENGKPNLSELEKETIKNMILNCISQYVIRDKKEGFYLNLISQSVLSSDNFEFKDKIKEFLIDVLDDMTHRKEKIKDEKGEREIEKGLYSAWAIAQCEDEINNDKT